MKHFSRKVEGDTSNRLSFQSKLRELAQKAREERAGLRPKGGKDDDEEVVERDDLRNARHKERARQRNIDRSAGNHYRRCLSNRRTPF